MAVSEHSILFFNDQFLLAYFIWSCMFTGHLVVDDKEYMGQSSGRHIGLDLTENMFLGGVPDYRFISPHTAQRSGFTGKKL